MQQLKEWKNNKNLAHVVPLVAFLVLMGVPQLIIGELDQFFRDHSMLPWWRRAPEHWYYPLQTILCAALLLFWRRHYTFNWTWKSSTIGLALGTIGIAFWLLPTQLHTWLGYSEANPAPTWLDRIGVQARQEGFDARIFGPNHTAFDHWADYTALLLRFLRAVVIVALVEEIFWRGFLMRYLLNPDGKFWNIPFGQPSWKTYTIVTLAFMLIHTPVDYLGALIYGSLMYLTAIWTRSLGACVLNHAIANLLMGLYALQTGKYGLW